MDLTNATYNRTRNLLTVHGRSYTVKKQKNKERYFIHAENKQITVTDIVSRKVQEPDPVFDYIFGGGFESYPCPAMDYWILRHRVKRKITIAQYKATYLQAK